MTAPNQPYPDMTAAIGEGAFEVSGGPTNAYGSTLTTSAIDTITKGAQADGVVDGSTALSKLTGYVGQLPAESMPLFGAAFGLTGPEVTSVMNFISQMTTPSTSPSTAAVLQRLSTDFAVLSDWFHQTYEEGSSTDTPTTVGTNGKMTTWAAWNDLMELIGLAAGTAPPTTPKPTPGTVVTGTTDGLTTWLNQLSDIVNNTVVTPLNSAVASFQTWWNGLSSTVSGHSTSIGSLNTQTAQQANYAARQAANAQVLADWAHTTYAFGSASDTAATRVGGKMTYCGAWNDNVLLLQQELGLAPAPITPTDPNASVTAASTAASSAQSAATAAQTAASTAQSTATAAQSAASAASSAASTAQGTANTNATQAARKAQNDAILADWLHSTYPYGSSTDTAATRVGGKPTYWGAWNDNWLLLGQMLGTSPTPPTAADGAAAVSTAQTTATAAQSAAGAANSAIATIAGTGTPGTVAPGQLNAVVPAAKLPNIAAGTGPGQSADLQTHLTNVAALGNVTSGTAVSAAQAALAMQQNTLSYVAAQVQGLSGGQTATSVYGQAYNVYFYTYPDTVAGTTGTAAFAQAPFNLSITGAGNAYLSILNGNAHWVKSTNGGDNTILGICNLGKTNTYFQLLQATISTLPGTNSRNYAVVHSDATGQNYTYAGVYLNSSAQLCWEVGYVIGGVDQGLLWSGVGAPLAFSFTLRAGVGGNPRRFQGVSGSQIVFDKTDTGAVMPLGYYHGFRSQSYSGGSAAPADANFVGVSDNALPATQGSGFRLSCSSTTQQSISVGTNTSPPGASPVWGYFPTGFFDTPTFMTPDMVPSTYLTTNDSITVETEGKYLFSCRAQMLATAATGVVSIYAGYLRNGVFEQIANGPSVTVNVFSSTWAPTALGGTAPVYCYKGDKITPIVYVDTQPGTSNALSALKVFGEANLRLTFWSLDRMFGA